MRILKEKKQLISNEVRKIIIKQMNSGLKAKEVAELNIVQVDAVRKIYSKHIRQIQVGA